MTICGTSIGGNREIGSIRNTMTEKTIKAKKTINTAMGLANKNLTIALSL
jgi:hypothetical protein